MVRRVVVVGVGVGLGVGRLVRWGWSRGTLREVLLVWEGECERSLGGGEVGGEVGGGLQRGCSRRRGRIRLLRARHLGGVLLRGRGRVAGEEELALALELERVRRVFVERMLDRADDRWCCCSPLLA